MSVEIVVFVGTIFIFLVMLEAIVALSIILLDMWRELHE